MSHNTYSLKRLLGRALTGASQKGELILTILMMLAQVAVILIPLKRRIQQGRQLSIGESFGIAATGSGVPQAKVDKGIVNLFVSNMIPLHVVESQSFGALIKTLNPSKSSISRRTLGRRITDEHIELKQHLIR